MADKDQDEKKKPKSFLIRTPNAAFRGERGGVKFMEGEGRTDDALAAQACQDFGYEVLDADSEEASEPRKEDEAKKKAKK